MKKIIITSSMLKKAHRNTKEMKKVYPEVNYRTQLSLEISKLLKDEREYQLEVSLRVKCLNWINKYITHNNTLDGSDLEVLSNKMNYDLNIKRYGFVKSYSKFTLAQEMVKRYSVQVQRYA
jgi:hypothetical protein